MYNGCSSLTTVKSCLEAPSTSYTDGWLSGVASSGSFFYSKAAKNGSGNTTWPSGTSGIPSGWVAYDVY